MSQDEPFHLRLRKEREQRHLSQQDLAELVAADVTTIRRWESGKIIPGPFLSRKLEDVLGMSLDRIGRTYPSEDDNHYLQPRHENSDSLTPHGQEIHEELSEAPYRIQFHGRLQELATLHTWIIDDRCQVVAILGVGGVGKTALAASVVEQCKPNFTKVLWRSLHNAPPFEYILNYCIQFISQQAYSALPESIEEQITLLIHYLQQEHCLLILDNVESIIQPGKNVGQYRSGYDGYGRLFQRLGEARHQSCLLLTGREKPFEVALLEGRHSPVRSFSLDGLELAPSRTMLGERDLFGQNEDWATLVKLYAGNPLALKLIAGPIEEVFNGDIATFLYQSESVFGDITHLLDQQFQRLSEQEQEILYWLAIEREAISINEIYQDIAHPLSRSELVDAFSSLRRRSLVERGSSDTFLLQPVILEYVTTLLVKQFTRSFPAEHNASWHQYAILKAQAKDYIKASQVLLITAPIAQALHAMMRAEDIEKVLLDRLAHYQQGNLSTQSYYPGNVLNLLIYLQRDLRGKDFSTLPIRQADLQNVLLPEVDFSHALFRDVSFTSTFGNVQSVTFSSHGDLVATGTASGEIWIYDTSSYNPMYIYRGHTDAVWSVVFNQDDTQLASCGDDRTIRLWDRTSGRCLSILHGHAGRVRSLAFHPHGRLLASASEDKSIYMWDVQTGAIVFDFQGHQDRVWSVAFSPDGKILASASTDHSVRIWDVETGICLKVLQGHTDWVRAIAFSPQGDILASCGDDMNIILWNTTTGTRLNTLHGHIGRVWTITFDASGQRLASGSEDQSIRIWDITNGTCTLTLQGHSNGIRSVAFNPAGHTIVSGGDDQTTRFWDVASGYCLRTLYGHTNRIWSALFGNEGQIVLSCHEDHSIRLWNLKNQSNKLYPYKTLHHHMHGARAIALAPHSRILASGGEDQLVRLWDIPGGRCVQTLAGHTGWIRAVAFDQTGSLLASGGEDHTIRLWDISLGRCIAILEGHHSWIRGLAFHPHKNLLASGSDDETIKLWDTATGKLLQDFRGHLGHVRSVCFHPQGNLLASGGEDGTLRLWDISTGTCLHQHTDHTSWVRCVCFNADGTCLASSSDDGTIHLYRLDKGMSSQALQGHSARVRCVCFNDDGQSILSSSDDGSIKIWNAYTGQCVQTLFTERLYEGMNITAAQGLTDAQKTLLQVLGAFEEESDQ